MASTPSELPARREVLRADATVRGAALRAGLLAAVDAELAALWAAAGAPGGLAVALVGAYGRGEPALGSDIDLVLVHDGRGDAAQAEALLYPLWDSGVPVDHSVRTPDEAVAVARGDLRAMLGLLDARHVAGPPELTATVRERVHAAWRAGLARRFPELAAAVAERGRAHAELAFLLEPDLKLARGGLRDVEALRALAAGWVAAAPGGRVAAAHELLLDVRGELHRRPGRPGDRLLMQEQDALASPLGFTDADALLTAVSDAGRAIAFATDETLRRVARDLRPSPRRWGRARGEQRRPLAEGVVEQDGEVVLARAADPAADPVLVLRAAAAAGAAGLPLATHTLARLAAESAPLGEPWPVAAREALVSLLGAGPGAVPVLEALDQAGLLVVALPEWAAVRCRPQRNAYHRFTVDRHLMEAAAQAAALTRRVARPDLLLVGALLHDIGKGWPGDHTDNGVRIAPAMAARLGFPAADCAVIADLVRHHLLLPDTATRRDLDDPRTVQRVAAAVGDRGRLELLHALTEADSLATGPAAWSDWKAGLVADLVARVRAVLAGEPPPAPAPLPPAAAELAARGEVAVDVDGSTVTVVAPDHPGLMWRWAGVLALHRLTVRAASASSLAGMAVTVFDAVPAFGSPPEWRVVGDDVRRAFTDAGWLADRLARREAAYPRPGAGADAAGVVAAPRVLFDDEASAAATVVEVRAHDRVGLLYRLARALADAGLDVVSARVSTLGAEAVDAFYVVDAAGAPLRDPDARRALARHLEAAAAESG